jgi:hypothetical protein
VARVLVGALGLVAAHGAWAQYPGQVEKKPQDGGEMRAVAVLEWTGDEDHPKTSRLIPITVYDGQQLQDAGIYLARPEPLALESEVEYELKENGKTVGLFDVSRAGQELGSWVGLGVWKPLPKPKPAKTMASTNGKDMWGNDDDGGDRPVLHRKHHDDDAAGSGGSGKGTDGGSGAGNNSGAGSGSADPDRPTLHKKSSSDDTASGGDATGGTGPAPDPDRPTLHKKTTDDSAGDDSAGSAPAADPDRPLLKKKTDSAKLTVEDGSVESVTAETDPDRPHLVRGMSAGVGGDVLPTLMGLPKDMQQAVAVSDAKTRPEHLWTYSWASPEDEAKMQAEVEELARKALGLEPPPATPAPKTAAKKTAVRKKALAPPPEPPAPAPLLDEQYRVFELAYNSGATVVLSAHTDGAGAQEKFVTLICQPDLYGNVATLMQNVTDAEHLDEMPRMRLVDAVDAMADNRGELLFELRGATERQFALYRVLRGQAEKVFTSGMAAIAIDQSDAKQTASGETPSSQKN